MNSQSATFNTLHKAFQGDSEITKQMLISLTRVITMKSSPILSGNRGVGKERLAHACHTALDRKGKFRVLDCAKFNDESISKKILSVQNCGSEFIFPQDCKNGDTLFIKNIDKLNRQYQGLFLSVLEKNNFSKFDTPPLSERSFYIIFSSVQNLRELQFKKVLREDLFFRMSGIEVRVPSLQHRISDLPDLIEQIVFDFQETTGRQFLKPDFAPEAYSVMANYSWPENVDELNRVIWRACDDCAGQRIYAEDIRKLIQSAKTVS